MLLALRLPLALEAKLLLPDLALARLGDHLQDRLRVAAPDVVAREAPLPPVALVDVGTLGAITQLGTALMYSCSPSRCCARASACRA